MSDVKRQVARRKEVDTSTFSHPSLVSPTTPTLAKPTSGFGTTNRDRVQTATEVSREFPKVQSTGDIIQEKPLGHDTYNRQCVNPTR
jgi:hypothetical protein